MIDHFIDTNGIRLHYVEHPGDGPTVLLFPGLNANAVFFQGLVREGLSPALRALAFDLRGRNNMLGLHHSCSASSRLLPVPE